VFRQSRLKRRIDGRIELRLPKAERILLKSLPSQVAELIEAGDPSTVRIFPPAYPDDPDAEAEYKSIARSGLLDRHRRALQVIADTADAGLLDPEEAQLWLAALNDMRLVIGTRLGVTEDMGPPPPADDPTAPARAVYDYLTWLQQMLVEVISSK
jgi:hypothetical protein